jgi:replication initiation factor
VDNGLPEIGVDYLTMTLPRGASNAGPWERQCLQSLRLLQDDGNEHKATRLLGYDGYMCGGAFYGENDERRMFRVSSAWADRLFTRTYDAEAHYSRLDVQVTWFFDVERQGLAAAVYDDLIRVQASKEGKSRLKCRLVTDNEGGSTVYIGSRTSAAMGRIYNKGAQSDEEQYRNAWRYEVEYHNSQATAAAGILWTHYGQSRQWIASNVAGWYDKRGVVVPWRRVAHQGSLPPQKRPPPDVARRLAWIEHQVRPTVAYLLEELPRAIVLEALGLSDGPAVASERQEEGLQ